MKKMLLVATGILLVSQVITLKSCQALRQEKNRLSDNQRVLMGDVDFYRTRDSLSAAGVERLQLTVSELRKGRQELAETIEDLNIRLRRLQSATVTGTQTRYEIKTIVRDSIIYRDSLVTDTISCIEFRNPYMEMAGCIDNGEFSGYLHSRDTLLQVVHRVPRKFLFIRWGTKSIRQEIVSKNPYSSIEYTEYIELKK